MIKAVMRETTAMRDPVPMTRLDAPLGVEVGELADPEVALRVPEVVVAEAEEAASLAALPLALALALDAEAETEEDIDIDIELDPVIDIAPDPVKIPSAILLVVTAAEFESELLYHA
jgi:hypothetical protein